VVPILQDVLVVIDAVFIMVAEKRTEVETKKIGMLEPGLVKDLLQGDDRFRQLWTYSKQPSQFALGHCAKSLKVG
jgi:hypothetical protein